MTITAQTSKTGPYNGNGTTTVFSYTFEVQDEAHLVVTLADASGVEIVQVLNTDYTVSGVGNASGGQITMTTAPASGYTLMISRTIPLTQDVDLENRRSVAPEVLEDAYDKLTQIAQDFSEQLGRSLKVAVSADDPANLPVGDRAGQFLAFDAVGDPTYASGTGADGALRSDLASTDAGKGSSLVSYQLNAVATIPRTVQSRLRDYVSVRDFGAVGDGVTDDTAAIQAAIDAISSAGGGNILIPAGTYMVSTIVPKDYVSLYGEGKDVTYLKQIVGTNATMIVSGTDLRGFCAFDFSTDGNYFQGAWNANPGILGNTSGGGIDIKPIACEIDIAINNHAGIGCLIRNATAFPSSAEYNVQTVISIEGKDFGKEGMIIAGMPDGIVKKAFLGRCGILPRPTCDTQLAVSDYYPGDPVDGVVVDGRNIEFELVHVYACWSGTGFRTRNTVRLTGMEIISESNLQQVNLSTGTYGSAKFDGRRFGLVHPDWSATLPVYDAAKHDAFYIQAQSGFKATITAHALIVPIKRIVGANIVNITGDDNNVEVSYRGTSPVDPLDPDYPGRYKHTSLKTSSGARGNLVNITAANARGLPIILDEGDGNAITVSLDAPVGGGVTAAGTNSSINATIFGQVQDGSSGVAFENTGASNTWVIAGGSNAVDYASSGSPGRTTVFGSEISIREIDIASGVLLLTAFDRVVSVRAEGGAGTDDLDNITGLASDQIVYLRGRNGQTITLNRNAGGTGNIRLGAATRVLNSANDFIQMIADGTNVIEVAYADNG